MVSGHRIVINDQMMGGISAYGKGVDSIKSELFDRSILELDEQSDHLAAFITKASAQERFLTPKRDAIHAGMPTIRPNRLLVELPFAEVTRTTMTVMLSSPPL